MFSCVDIIFYIMNREKKDTKMGIKNRDDRMKANVTRHLPAFLFYFFLSIFSSSHYYFDELCFYTIDISLKQ